MKTGRRVLFHAVCVCACQGLLIGCGGSGSDSNSAGTAQGTAPKSAAAPAKETLPTAAIGALTGPEESGDEPLEIATPSEGSAEWCLSEIVGLKLKPYPATDDPDAQRAARKARNQEIIKLAEEAVALTHQNQEQERLFNVAVHHLLDARLQLSLLGDEESIQALYAEAEVLHKRAAHLGDPQAESAAEAAHTLARLAHSNAQRHGDEEPRWLEEFVRQARLYAANFPKHEKNAVPLLIAAGRSCELQGKMTEAIACYTMIEQTFPNNPATPQIVAMLRRLNIGGRPLELAGPTMDGKFVSIDDYKGKVVLVVFWAAVTEHFASDAPQLIKLSRDYEKYGFRVIGVNLDEDELEAQVFLEKADIAWPQIFYSEPDKRGWSNPLASHYGIVEIPSYWLVDHNGLVAEAGVSIDDLEDRVKTLLKNKTQDSAAQAPTGAE